jgi:hypothetical protein
VEFFFKIDPKPEELIKGVTDKVVRARRAGMINAVTAVEAGAVKRAPVKTSNLVNSATSDVSQDGLKGEIRFTINYAKFVHEGTYDYGPNGKGKIAPRNTKGFYFSGKSGTQRVADPVKQGKKGMKGRPFLTDAAKAVDLAKEYGEGMERFLSADK